MQIKRRACTRSATLAIAALLGAAVPALAAEPLPPASAFFNPPDLQAGQLSPSGRYVSFIAGQPAEFSRLTVVDTQSKAPPHIVTQAGSGGLRAARWLTDDLLTFVTVQSPNARTSGMFTVARDGSNLRPLDLMRGNMGPGRSAGGPYGLWFTLDTYGEPPHLIVEDGSTMAEAFNVFRAWEWDVGASKWRRVLRGEPPHPQVYEWLYDRQARPRVAFARDATSHVWFYNTAAESDTAEHWREMGRWATGPRPFTVVSLLPDGRLGVTVPNAQTGLEEFREFDIETRQPKDKAVVSVPGFDVNVDEVTESGRLLGLRVKTDDWETAWQEPAMKELQQQVDKLLPGRVNFLSCKGCATAESVLVHSYSDRQPGEYLHYSGKTGEWQNLGSDRAALDEARMGRTQLLRVAARDGLEVPVWVTAPAGLPLKDLRTVVRVHDGPWQRGRDWGFNAEAQFLASRGYLVIEPEFRGSKGFGDKLYRAGLQQWGGRMQDDLMDALAAVVAKGWADPKQVCIAGEGYGGYAALMALAQHGEAFRCGVAASAMTDLPTWLEKVRDPEQRALVGDLKRDVALLAANSPRTLAAKIKAPLLLAHGEYDEQVPVDQAKAMRDALAAAGRPPQWVLYGDESHRWRNPNNQIDFWQRVERFLDQNLKQ